MLRYLISMKIFFFSISVVRSLNDLPIIENKSSKQIRNVSSNVQFVCQVKNLTSHHVTWFKVDRTTSALKPLAVGEKLFVSDSRFSVSSYSTSSDESFWFLEIYRVHFDDEGTYLCQIANRYSTVRISIDLILEVPISLRPNSFYIELDERLELICCLSISLNSTNSFKYSFFNWTFHSNNRTKPTDVQIKKSLRDQQFCSILTVFRASFVHNGFWTCHFRNQRQTVQIFVDRSEFLFLSNGTFFYPRNKFFVFL